METVSIIIAVIAGLGVMVLLFKPFFGNADGFFECLKFWLTPEIFSLIFGKFFQDIFSEMKLGLWILCGAGTGIGVFVGLMKLFG